MTQMTLVLIGQRPCFGGFNLQNRGQTGSRYNLNIFLQMLYLTTWERHISYVISNHKNPVALFYGLLDPRGCHKPSASQAVMAELKETKEGW